MLVPNKNEFTRDDDILTNLEEETYNYFLITKIKNLLYKKFIH
jgi:hypothetical protein